MASNLIFKCRLRHLAVAAFRAIARRSLDWAAWALEPLRRDADIIPQPKRGRTADSRAQDFKLTHSRTARGRQIKRLAAPPPELLGNESMNQERKVKEGRRTARAAEKRARKFARRLQRKAATISPAVN